MATAPPAPGNRRQFFRGGLHARRNPYPLMLVLAVVGSSLIFFFIIFLMLVRKSTVGMPPVRVPILFYFSSLLAALSSAAFYLARYNYRAERFRQYLNLAGITLVLGTTFVLTQAAGWWQVYYFGYTFRSPAAAYLYILSGLHFLHMLVALSMLGWCVSDAARHTTYIDGFIQALNPAKQTRLRLTYWLWHYVDALWLILFCLFLFVLAR